MSYVNQTTVNGDNYKIRDYRLQEGYAQGSIQGVDSQAGAKGWQWSAFSGSSGDEIITFTLNDITGIEINDEISCKADYSYNFCGIVVNTYPQQNKIDVSLYEKDWPTNWNPASYISSSNGYLWIPEKSSIGNYVFGSYSVAFDGNNKANEMYSVAVGYNNISDGRQSFTSGLNNKAGYAAHAEGSGTQALKLYSHSEGLNTIARGMSAHAEGTSTEAAGNQAHSEGLNTYATGNSHAEGSGTEATNASHAEGSQTHATGQTSHAEGINTEARKRASHAEGEGTHSTGDYSHAEGYQTTSGGNASHAEGSGSVASGNKSHAEGTGTIASKENQHAQGKYNYELGATYVDIVGWGSNATTRKNIYALSTSGNIMLKGDVYVGCSDQSTGGTALFGSIGNINTQIESLTSGLASKQDTLVSGTNIKTINNNSILGSGNLSINSISNAWDSSNGALRMNDSGNTASGEKSIAFGQTTTASGLRSFAGGNGSKALGTDTAAIGCQTIAGNADIAQNQVGQIATGLYNVQLGAGYLNIVGAGTSTSARKNVQVLKTTGDMVLAGKLYINASDDACTQGTEVQTKLVSGSTIRTINNTSVLGSGNIAISGSAISVSGTTLVIA